MYNAIYGIAKPLEADDNAKPMAKYRYNKRLDRVVRTNLKVATIKGEDITISQLDSQRLDPELKKIIADIDSLVLDADEGKPRWGWPEKRRRHFEETGR